MIKKPKLTLIYSGTPQVKAMVPLEDHSEECVCATMRFSSPSPAFTLESVYRNSRDEIVTALRTIFGLTTVTVESQSVTAHAITWYAEGMDFGDAMILASSAGADKVATFDRDFQRLAARIGATPRVEQFKA